MTAVCLKRASEALLHSLPLVMAEDTLWGSLSSHTQEIFPCCQHPAPHVVGRSRSTAWAWIPETNQLTSLGQKPASPQEGRWGLGSWARDLEPKSSLIVCRISLLGYIVHNIKSNLSFTSLAHLPRYTFFPSFLFDNVASEMSKLSLPSCFPHGLSSLSLHQHQRNSNSFPSQSLPSFIHSSLKF